MRRRRWAAASEAAALAGLFFAGAVAGVWLSRESGNIAAFWPPNAILLGFLLRSRRTDRTLPMIACVLANLAFNRLHGDPFVVSVGFTCANMLEVACAYGLVARLAGLPLRLVGLRQLLVFLLAAALSAPIVGATVGAALISRHFEVPFWTVWQTWWTAGAVGMVLFVPLFVTCDGGRRLRARLARSRGNLAAVELAVVACLLIAALALTIGTGRHAFTVLFTPFLLWLALRFGIGATAAAAAVVCVTAVVASVHGAWPLPVHAGATVAARVAPLQLFIVATILPSLLVAVVVAERRRMARELRDAKRWLDDALESMADGLALFDAEQRLLFCNRRYLACFPKTSGLRVPGARLADLRRAAVREGEFKGVDESNGDAWIARQTKLYATAGQAEYELGDGRHMLASMRRTGADGLVVVWHDITERKRLALELERAQQRLHDAIESLPDAFALFDADERLVICNNHHKGFFPAIADRLEPGIRFEDAVRASVEHGCLAGVAAEEADAFAARMAARHRQGNARYEFELADGRRVQTTARRTREGGIVGIRRDVTELRRAQKALEHAASHDALTELANRAAFKRALEQAWGRAQRGRHRFAVMLIDLDRFKAINDKLGHAVGDRLLIEVAVRLRAALREGDLAARLGGDEFAILAEGSEAAEFATLAARLVERLSTPARFDGIEVRPGASLGYTVFPDDRASPSELLIHADRALYAAKHAGRGTWTAHAPEMRGARGDSVPHHDEMAAALERGEFELHYQPIVALDRFEVLGVEALLRWRHPERGLLPAGAFIGAAERRPLILDLTRDVLRRALRQQRAWMQGQVADVRMWVNLAPRCLARDGLVDAVASELAATGVPAQRLVLEITEGAFADIEAAEARVASLRRLGVGLAIDDFGAGYSSLARLRGLPMDTVKIDRAFIADVAQAARDRAIVRTIVALGDNLGLTPLAEGIETSEQLREVRELGCLWGQGYLFARPMPAERLTSWLATWNDRRAASASAATCSKEGSRRARGEPGTPCSCSSLVRRSFEGRFMSSLQDAVVVIAGASSGIGRAAAQAFARRGANLVLASRREDTLADAAADCSRWGVEALAVPTDVTDPPAVKRLAEAAIDRFGRIDVWINNAGVGAVGEFDAVPIEAHDQVIRTNLMGEMHGAHAVLPHFKARGRGILINTISLGAWVPSPYAASYTASKFGLRGFSEALRAELQDWSGIHVCDVFPTFVDTPGVSHGANYTGREIKLPPGAIGPFDVAEAMVSLALRPRNTVTVGLTATLARLGYAVCPPAMRWGMARFMEGYFRQARPVPVSDGNLFQAPDDHRVHGGWRRDKPAVPTSALAVGAVLAGMWLGRRFGRGGRA